MYGFISYSSHFIAFDIVDALVLSWFGVYMYVQKSDLIWDSLFCLMDFCDVCTRRRNLAFNAMTTIPVGLFDGLIALTNLWEIQLFIWFCYFPPVRSNMQMGMCWFRFLPMKWWSVYFFSRCLSTYLSAMCLIMQSHTWRKTLFEIYQQSRGCKCSDKIYTWIGQLCALCMITHVILSICVYACLSFNRGLNDNGITMIQNGTFRGLPSLSSLWVHVGCFCFTKEMKERKNNIITSMQTFL